MPHCQNLYIYIHLDGALMHIITGQIDHADFNADDVINLGQWAIGDFKGGWLGCFTKLIVAMDVMEK